MTTSVRQQRRQMLHKLSRRRTLLLSALVGAAAGLVAVVFRLLVNAVESWRHTTYLDLWRHHHVLGLVAVLSCGASLGALAAWATRRFCPEAGGSGIPHVKAILLTGQPFRAGRVMAVKMGAGLLALGAGMSLGREGPTVHIGSALAEEFSKLAKLPARTRRALLAAGAGAGLAAAFNAPLAGFLFILEELRKDLSRETYGNALVTSVTSVGVAQLCLGYSPTFTSLSDDGPLHLSSIPILIAIGLIGSAIGSAFNYSLLRATAKSGNRVVRGAVAGALGGVLALTLPLVTGSGDDLTYQLLRGDSAADQVWSHLLLLLVLKLFYTVLCYATGVPGGFFAPLLTMGAVLGSLVSVLLVQVIPDWTPSPERLATVGMAAVLTASVRAPLTCVVLIVEMTGEYHIIYSLLLVSFISHCAAELWGSEPIYEALVERDLKLNPHKGEPGFLEVLVEPASALDGLYLRQLQLKEDMLIAMIERDGEALIPHGATRILSGDILTVVLGARCAPMEHDNFLESARAP